MCTNRTPERESKRESRLMNGIQAIQQALAEEMRRDDTVVVLGEGIGERGGCFGHTLGLWDEFGPERLIDTPISELSFTGLGIGAAAAGVRPVVDLMFMDFLLDAMGQVVHQAAKMRYVSAGQFHCPMVFAVTIGRYRHGGPHHSDCYYPMLMHIPGLKVVLPSSVADLKGLLKSSIRDNDPVVLLEHKSLLSSKMEVPDGENLIPLGKGNICRAGGDMTIVAMGEMVAHALVAAESLAEDGIAAEVIDPRTLVPLDLEMIFKSVKKTRRLVIVDEAHETCNAAAEIAAQVACSVFEYLDAPVRRVSTSRCHIPYAPPMEAHLYPSPDKIETAARQLLGEAAVVVHSGRSTG